jgi:F0F1-type ATP synthase epsilon subunit
MKKNLDISEDAVEIITIQAVREKTVFKLKAQQIIEDAAKEIDKKSKSRKTK